MKGFTKQKLDKLASHMASRFGDEITETAKFLSISKREADKLGISIHIDTLKTNEKYLAQKIESAAKSDMLHILKDGAQLSNEEKLLALKDMAAQVAHEQAIIEAMQHQKSKEEEFKERYERKIPEVIEIKEDDVVPIKIKVILSNGTHLFFVPEAVVEEKTKNDTALHKEEDRSCNAKEERIWTGLFDYRLDKKILIRRGAHAGCDITDINDILSYFGTYKHVLAWIRFQLQPQVLSKLKSPDTEKDMKCLERMRKYVISQRGF